MVLAGWAPVVWWDAAWSIIWSGRKKEAGGCVKRMDE